MSEKPDIHIIFVKNWYKLLVIYNSDNMYYVDVKSYKDLRYFKTPSHIDVFDDYIVLSSKNGKNMIVLMSC